MRRLFSMGTAPGLFGLALALVLFGCKRDETQTPEAAPDTSGTAGIEQATGAAPARLALPEPVEIKPGDFIPAQPDALSGFLHAGGYKSWAQESAVMESDSSFHLGSEQTYINGVLKDSLEAGNPLHPEGAASVKEIYDADKNQTGWAVSIKTQADTAMGQGWYWYDVRSMETGAAPVMAGQGHEGCIRCHNSRSVDFVKVSFPLR